MPGGRPVLVIDDDRTLRSLLVEQFEVDGEFSPTEAGSLSEAQTILNLPGSHFDAIVLDVRLPDGDGRQFCALLRHRGIKVPILILTGSHEEVDVISGLGSGANDYIAKPFRIAEFLARLRAQLRIFENSDDAIFNLGPYTFRPSAKSMHHGPENRRIRLTEKETAILKYLYRAGTKPVSRQVLLNEVWGYNADVTTHTLETHIYRLRQKIETDPAAARILITEAGGYRLNFETE